MSVLSNVFKKQPNPPSYVSNLVRKHTEQNIPTIQELGKQLTIPEYQKLLAGYDAEPHREDYKVLEDMYRGYPIITAAINKTVDFVMGKGFRIKDRDHSTDKETIIMDFMKEQEADQLLRQAVRDMLLFGDAYWEIVKERGTGKIQALKSMNAKQIYLKRKQSGEIVEYIQITKGHLIKKEDMPRWKPEEIAHFQLNPIGNDAYGTGIVSPLKKHASILMRIETLAERIAKRKANSYFHVKVGDENRKPTTAELDSVVEALQDLKEDEEFVTSSDVSVESTDAGKKVMDLGPLMEHFTQQLIYGVEVPATLLGMANVPEGLAKAQAEAYERRIISIQRAIQATLEDQVFPLIVEGADFDFDWKIPNHDEKMAEITALTTLLGNLTIHPELRMRMEDRLNELLGFEPLPKDRLEMDTQPMQLLPPQVDGRPGEPRPPNTQPANPRREPAEEGVRESAEEAAIRAELQNDYTIEAYVGFDYKELLTYIKREIKRTNYKALILPAILEPYSKNPVLNMFSGNPIRALPEKISVDAIRSRGIKKVLSTGFEQGLSVRTMAKMMQPYVDKLEISRDTIRGQDGSILQRAYHKIFESDERSVLITRSEIVRISNNARIEQNIEMGLQEGLWVTQMDGRQCEECASMNGKVYPLNQVRDYAGNVHINCRCFIQGISPVKD